MTAQAEARESLTGVTHRIGYLSPDRLIHNGPYEFYRLAPDNVLMLYISMAVDELTAAHVEEAYEEVDALVRLLKSRNANILVQGGVPLPLATGRAYHDALLQRMAEVGGMPATSTVECVIDAIQGMGLSRVVVANKWSDKLNRTLADEFFTPAGIEIVGVSNRELSPSVFRKFTSDDSVGLALELGRAGFEAHPEAEALYIGGGSWMATKIVPLLEDRFGKPVITNTLSCTWSLCRRLGIWQPKPGFGTLISKA